jgi:hypothetical protein
VIRFSPAETYIKYLLLLDPRSSVTDVHAYAESVGLDAISPEYVKELRERLHPPQPFRPEDRSHQPSTQFLLRHRIDGLFHQGAEATKALQLLDQPRAKEIIEAFTLVGAPLPFILSTLDLKFQIEVTLPTLQTYCQYFWNLSLLDATEIRMLLELRHADAETQVARGKSSQGTALYNAKNAVRWKDSRYTAASLPKTAASMLLVQVKAGIALTPVNRAQMLEAIIDNSLAQAFGLSVHGGISSAEGLLKYMTSVKIASEMLSDLSPPEAKLLKQIQNIQLLSDTSTVPSINQLSAGNHTIDLGPVAIDDPALKGKANVQT